MNSFLTQPNYTTNFKNNHPVQLDCCGLNEFKHAAQDGFSFPMKMKMITITGKIPSNLPPAPCWGSIAIYQRIVSVLYDIHRKTGKFRLHYFQFHSTDLQSIAKNYRDYIDYLILHKVLQVNEQYQFNQSGVAKENLVEAFCKQYAFTQKYVSQTSDELIKITYKIKKKHGSVLQLKKSNHVETPSTAAIKEILENRVSVDEAYENDGLSELSYNWLRRTELGILSAKQGRTGRMYYNVTYMNGEARKYIKIDGEKTSQIDLKTLFPFLTLTMCENRRELEAWTMLLEDDFYVVVGKVVGSDNRDYCKQIFPKWLSGKYTGATYGAVFKFAKFMKQFFPVLNAKIEKLWSDGVSLAAYFQDLESNVVVKKVFQTLNVCGIPTLPVHDCLICKESDLQTVRDTLLHTAKAVWKIEPKIKIN